MPRILPIKRADATGKVKQLLDGVESKLGMVPQLMTTLANSPAALEAYLAFSGSLGQGFLDPAFREQIALAVAQANSCEYCLSAHAALGALARLTPEEIEASREARSTDARKHAGLEFAQSVVVQRGDVPGSAIDSVRAAGYSDGEIVEIVAHVALNVLTNYVNHVARTQVDFPRVPVAIAKRAA